jgi:hypothetical protein
MLLFAFNSTNNWKTSFRLLCKFGCGRNFIFVSRPIGNATSFIMSAIWSSHGGEYEDGMRAMALIMEAVCTSETSVCINWTARCYNPKNCHFHLFIECINLLTNYLFGFWTLFWSESRWTWIPQRTVSDEGHKFCSLYQWEVFYELPVIKMYPFHRLCDAEYVKIIVVSLWCSVHRHRSRCL